MNDAHSEVVARQRRPICTSLRLIHSQNSQQPCASPATTSCGCHHRRGSVHNGIAPIAVAVGASLMLTLGAVLTLPYAYFSLLRVVVFGCSAYLALLLLQAERVGLGVALGGMALLFNPFMPVYLARGIWQVIDVGAAGLMIASVVVLNHLKTR